MTHPVRRDGNGNPGKPDPQGKGGAKHLQAEVAKYGPGFAAFLWAIAIQEGNGYDLVNPSSGALGRYQVMPANVPSWTERALGHSLSATEFLNNPHAQDKTVIYILGHDYQKYGARGAAATWYSGQPSLANDYNPQKNGPSVGDYVDSVVGRMPNAPAKLHLANGHVTTDGAGPAGAGGGAGGSGGGGTVPTERLSKGAIAEGLNSMGFASQLINSNKSLRDAFRHILHLQLNLSSAAGQARAKQILQNTAWFQNHTDAQQLYEKLKYSAPKELQKKIDDARASLVTEAQQLGLHVDDNELDKLATIITRNGLTSDEINQHLAHQFSYNPHQGYTGQIGSSIDQIKNLATAYYVPTSDHQIQHLTRQVISGGMDPSSVENLFKERAASLFPYLKSQLQNQTVADIADPYKQMMANTLELDPNAIKHNDQTVMQALQHKDAQSGELGLMPLWQFQNHLYNDPRWLQTNNAHQSLVGTTGQLLQQMGLIT